MIAALGAACEVAERMLPAVEGTIGALTNEFWNLLREAFGEGILRHGHPNHRLPNTLYVSFLGRRGPEVLARAPMIAASTGSACHSGNVKPSAVLTAMGVDPEIAVGAVRFSLGRSTTCEELKRAVAELRHAVGGN